MAKPKIFLSSTCYDLSRVRSSLDEFLTERGFEVINSESHSFGVDPGKHSHTACINAVKDADYLLLLIGTRSGGTYIASESSITNEEYRAAQDIGIPCIVCVDRRVDDYRVTYKKNPKGDHKHIVDDPRVFHFIDYVASGHSDNWIHRFETIEDLKKILTTQFAHYLSRFSQEPRKRQQKKEEDQIIRPFPKAMPQLEKLYKKQDEVTAMRNGLTKIHALIQKIQTSSIKADAKGEKLKLLWVAALRGEVNDDGCRLYLGADNLKQYAWSYGRARRVNAQFADFGVKAYITEDGEDQVLKFDGANLDAPIGWAMKEYVNRLVKLHPAEGEALRLFTVGDMSCYE